MFSRRSSHTAEATAPNGPQRHRSLAIGYANSGLLDGERKVEILDLGAACGETLAYYTGLPCKLHFVDCHADLEAARRDDDENPARVLAAACEKVLSFDESTRFDLILTWDLFNYLSREEIGALTAHVRRFSSDSAPLMSMIWTKPRIPAQPNRYAIIDSETIEYRPTTKSERPGPRYSEPDLLRAMPGYRAGRSFLLRHGIQEYIFEPRVTAELGGRKGWTI